MPSFGPVIPLARALLLATTLLLAASLPTPGPPRSASAQAALAGRVLASARGQVAWLDFLAPRPTPLTQLVRPAYPADVAGAADVPFAVASVVSELSGSGAMGGDLVLIDLQTNSTRTLLARQSDSESLDLPAIWPDGSAILYQRSNLRVAVPMPGQAQPQYESRIEQIDPDGANPLPLLENARYPGPAPDGAQFAFVRSTDGGAAIFSHSLLDGSDRQLVAPGQFLALAYPRFSPDGQALAFAAIGLLAPVGRPDVETIFGTLSTRTAQAHGFPWEVWIVNADGTGLRQIPDVQDDDPSIAWSPHGSQLLIYGGWGSYVVEASTGAASSLPFLAGYGSTAWLPE
jgi:Tol biopolymer transport system component